MTGAKGSNLACKDFTCLSCATKRLWDTLHPLPCGRQFRPLGVWLGFLGAKWIPFAARLSFPLSPHTVLPEGPVKEDSPACVSPVHICGCKGSRLWFQAVPLRRLESLWLKQCYFSRLLLGIDDVMIRNHLSWHFLIVIPAQRGIVAVVVGSVFCGKVRESHVKLEDVAQQGHLVVRSACLTAFRRITFIRLFFFVGVTFQTGFLSKILCHRTRVVLSALGSG